MSSSVVVRRVGALALAFGFLSAGVHLEAKSKKNAPQPVVNLGPLHKTDVYLPSVMQWERPEKAGPNDWMSATAHINVAVFYPSGDFVGGRIAVNRLPNGELAAEPKADYSLRRGTWTRNGKDILVVSRWVKYEKGEEPKKKKSKPVKETWSTDPKNDKALAHYIVFGATEYVQADSLQNPEALETMFK